MRNIAFKRHHRARMEAHARKIIKTWEIDESELEFYVAQNADNLQVCSCFGCGNPRHNKWGTKKERLTIAERRMNESFKDQMDVIN